MKARLRTRVLRLINSMPNTQTPNATPGPTGCGGLARSATSMTVNGITGSRLVVNYPNGYQGCIGGAIVHEVWYTFTTGGRTYALDYAYRQGDAKDLTSEFDLMVQSVRLTAS